MYIHTYMHMSMAARSKGQLGSETARRAKRGARWAKKVTQRARSEQTLHDHFTILSIYCVFNY